MTLALGVRARNGGNCLPPETKAASHCLKSDVKTRRMVISKM